jgi:putative intracellular protease/amidase
MLMNGLWSDELFCVDDEETMPMLTVIMPLPLHDFDPTEAAVSWQTLRAAGHQVVFATPDGQMAHADPIMLTGQGLDVWGQVPVLKKITLIGRLLRAQHSARQAYAAMTQDANFRQPRRYDQLQVADYDGLLLAGGHAKGMRPYLESTVLQRLVADFFETVDQQGQHKPIAAVCHGVLLAARSLSPTTGRSVLYGRKTTALTWQMEQSAWRLTRGFARYWDPLYYRTYAEQAGEPVGYWSVEHEIKRLLAHPDDFLDVPKHSPHYLQKTSGVWRDQANQSRPAWVVQDGNYLSARWPGDVYTFSQRFAQLLADQHMDCTTRDEPAQHGRIVAARAAGERAK